MVKLKAFALMYSIRCLFRYLRCRLSTTCHVLPTRWLCPWSTLVFHSDNAAVALVVHTSDISLCSDVHSNFRLVFPEQQSIRSNSSRNLKHILLASRRLAKVLLQQNVPRIARFIDTHTLQSYQFLSQQRRPRVRNLNLRERMFRTHAMCGTN